MHDFITISVPKTEFRGFFENEITDILQHMSALTKGKVFLPTEVSESIVMPDDDVMITMRNSTNVKNIPLGGWFINDSIKLCKKLCVKTISIPKGVRVVQNISDHMH